MVLVYKHNTYNLLKSAQLCPSPYGKNDREDKVDIITDSFFVCQCWQESTFRFSKLEPWGLFQVTSGGAIGRILELKKEWEMRGCKSKFDSDTVIKGWTPNYAKTQEGSNVATGLWYLYHVGSAEKYGTAETKTILEKLRLCDDEMDKILRKNELLLPGRNKGPYKKMDLSKLNRLDATTKKKILCSLKKSLKLVHE
jgi:hypothetical protein